MRWRDALAVGVVLALLAGAGCKRLTFIRSDPGRRDVEQVAPRYSFKDAPGSHRELDAYDRMAIAEQKFRAGDLDAAESEAGAAAGINPDFVDPVTLLAVIAERRGKAGEAGRLYAKAAAMAPARGAVLNNYAAWLCGNGRAAESLPLFERALADPNYPTPAAALANSGSCADLAGQPQRADQDLRRALDLDPVQPLALAAMAEHELHAGHYLEARAFSERRLAAAPASARTLLIASQIEQKLGDKAAADRYVRRLRAEFPDASAANPGEEPK